MAGRPSRSDPSDLLRKTAFCLTQRFTGIWLIFKGAFLLFPEGFAKRAISGGLNQKSGHSESVLGAEEVNSVSKSFVVQ